MVKIFQIWERKKLGASAPSVTTTDCVLLYDRTVGFQDFCKWVDQYGVHYSCYIHCTIEVDESYDKTTGMAEILIKQPIYRCRVHRKREGWGENHYGSHLL